MLSTFSVRKINAESVAKNYIILVANIQGYILSVKRIKTESYWQRLHYSCGPYSRVLYTFSVKRIKAESYCQGLHNLCDPYSWLISMFGVTQINAESVAKDYIIIVAHIHVWYLQLV